MNVQTSFPLPAQIRSRSLPADVDRLFPRERQIAMFVYEEGCVTAKDVEVALDRRLQNAAVRSMLNRLVKKGVLARHEMGSGAYLYSPALTQVSVEESLLRQFADDFYDGSLRDLICAIADLAAETLPPGQSEIGTKEIAVQAAGAFA